MRIIIVKALGIAGRDDAVKGISIDDNRVDLWSVFNRIQENLIRGGLVGRGNRGRRQRTRPVQSIDQDLRLNRALWLLADGLHQLKA